MKFPTFTAPKPKKLDPKQKKLSENVQKFLAKKKEEELKAQEEARRKKQKLMELRNQDKKAKKRVGQMLRMTKSANKSVIAEAKDCLQDSLTEQGILTIEIREISVLSMSKLKITLTYIYCVLDGYQPDEDDYGYVSQHAAEYHQKMLEKYRAIPASKPAAKTSHNGVQIAEAKPMRSKPGGDDFNQEREESHEDKIKPNASDSKPQKKRPPRPPVECLNFNDLLQLAQKKCQEPVIIKPKVQEDDKYEFGRPMTAKEKDEYLKEKAIRDKINKGKFALTDPKSEKPKPSSSGFKIPNKKAKDSAAMPPPSRPVAATPATPKSVQSNTPKASTIPNFTGNRNNMNTKPATSLPSTNSSKSGLSNSSQHRPVPIKQSDSQLKTSNKFPAEASRKPSKPEMGPPHPRPRPAQQQPMKKPRPSSPPPAYSKNRLHTDRGHPPSPPIHIKPKDKRESFKLQILLSFLSKKIDLFLGSQVIDSEEEEEELDSEMEDFIDDSDIGGTSISDMIRSITGYDKRRYKDDSDDECMETSAWEQMREERRSLKIGKFHWIHLALFISSDILM